MAKVKIKNQLTGEIKEVDTSELASYGLTLENLKPTQTNTQETQNPQYITGKSLEEHTKALQVAQQANRQDWVKKIQSDIDRA